MQNWPEKTVSACTILGAAASTSASSKTRIGVLPPSSSPSRLIWGAALAEMVRPVWLLPVKLITGTSGEVTSASPASWPPVKRFTTPRGRSGVCEMISAISAFT